MNLLQLISDLEKVDPEVYERFDSRRRVFKHLGSISQKAVATALPAVLSTLFNKAYAGTTGTQATVVEVLNAALSLEYLEFYFYDNALRATNYFSADDRPALELIRNDESGHVKALRETITRLQGTPVSASFASFDYTGGSGSMTGPFRDAFTNAATFFSLAQAFEDFGVRAYKGAATLVMTDKSVLTAALDIHSVEARHASHIRTIRRGRNQPTPLSGAAAATQATPGTTPAALRQTPKSWVSGTDGNGPVPTGTPSTAPVYGAGVPANGSLTDVFFPNEANFTQLGFSTTATVPPSPPPGGTALSLNTTVGSEAFDEGLDLTTVKTFARNFVTTASGLFV